MMVKILKIETNEVIATFDNPQSIYDKDLFSFRITDKWGGVHWYNASFYKLEVQDES